MKYFKKIKLIVLVFYFLLPNYVFSYNDNPYDCSMCEQYDRCGECYGYEDDTETSDVYSCPCQKINKYSGKFEKKRVQKFADDVDWPGEKPMGNYVVAD